MAADAGEMARCASGMKNTMMFDEVHYDTPLYVLNRIAS